MNYAAALGYDIFDENETIPVGDLARQMMTNGYVSPERLQAAETLKITVPAALRNLGIESDSTGTETMEAAIQRMQSSGNGTVAETLNKMSGQENVGEYYVQALKRASGSAAAGSGSAAAGSGSTNPYKQYAGGSTGGSSAGAYGNSDYVNELLKLYGEGGAYDQALEDARALIDANVAQIAAQYEGQKGNVSRSHADLARQLYIDRENAQKNIEQQMAAQGITGGASESALLTLNTSYQEALRESEQERINTLNELDQAIQQAKLTGDISFAEQALALAQQRADNYAGVLQLLMNRQDAAEQLAYERQMATYNQQLAAQETAFNKQMAAAELLASMGDFSGYKALGLTDAQIAALGKNYTAQNTPRSSSGGGGGMPTSSNYYYDLIKQQVDSMAAQGKSNSVVGSMLDEALGGGLIDANEYAKLKGYAKTTVNYDSSKNPYGAHM